MEGEEDKRGRRREGVGARGYEKGDRHTNKQMLKTREVVGICTFSLWRGLLRGVAGMLLIAGLGRGVATLLRLEKRLTIRHCSAGGSNEKSK